MKVLLYANGASSNHGCEAIVRSTVQILGDKNHYKLISIDKSSDCSNQLDSLCTIQNQLEPISHFSFGYLKALIQARFCKIETAFDELAFRNVLEAAKTSDLALSLGGDNYCYGRPSFIYFMNQHIRKQNVCNVLWGCSIEENDLDEEMKEDLCAYDYIFARESITYETMKKIGANVFLYPDPAFSLEVKYDAIPDRMKQKDTIGINISPMVINNENATGITIDNYVCLIQWILDHTDMEIVLVPHVCQEGNDDRQAIKQLLTYFPKEERLYQIEEQGCESIKGVISKCRFFIGARTHATIAAYSTCVPTLVLGYSVKARGIAKDLFGTEKDYVLSVQSLKKRNDLLEHFQFIYQNEEKIRTQLRKNMPDYKKQSQMASVKLNELLNKNEG